MALPDGTYTVGTTPTNETIPARTVCASDNSRPSLSDSVASVDNMAQLMRFGELTANSMTVTIKGNSITKVWYRDADLASIFPWANTGYSKPTCTVTWSGTIATNNVGILQEKGAYTITWSPSDCEFEVHNYATTGGSVGTGAWVKASIPSILANSTSTKNQSAWNLSKNGNVYTLTMPASVASTQNQYSCPNGNAVKMVWTKQ